MESKVNKVASELCTRILQFIYRPNNGKGRSVSFLYGSVGCADYDKRMGTELYFDEELLLETAFYLRENGAFHLKRIPIKSIESMIKEFITAHYGYLAEESFMANFTCSYDEFISDSAKNDFSNALATSKMLAPKDIFVTYPIQIINPSNEYCSDIFSIVKAKSLFKATSPVELNNFDITPDIFPPSQRLSNKHYEFQSWLCVAAPDLEAANKKKFAILGALALKYDDNIRHQFNSKKLVGGYCSYSDEMSLTIGAGHTPSVHQDLVITTKDSAFLQKLEKFFESKENDDFRKLRALEYFYRAWFLEESERFPFMFMALESLYGDGTQPTLSVIKGVKQAVGFDLCEKRIRLLAELRGSIVHGGAPEIYDSKKYAKYYKRYKTCPSRDLGILVAECIRVTAFDSLVPVQENEYQEQINEAIASGRIPKNIDRSILSKP